MLGVIVNTCSVIVGSLVGFLFKKHVKEEICNSILKVIGICVIVLGILGIVKSSVTINDNQIKTNYELALIICLALGTLLGEILKIDDLVIKIGNKVEQKFKKEGIANGFVTASIVMCVGALAIVGSAEAALGDNNTLYMKALLDLITAIVLSSTLGIGVLFASITIFIYQGLFVLIISLFGDILPVDFINCFSLLGYVMVMTLGFNFVFNTKIKVANMLPALLLIIPYYIFFIK